MFRSLCALVLGMAGGFTLTFNPIHVLGQEPDGRQRYSGVPRATETGGLTFRFMAPAAESVKLIGGDLPGVGRGLDLTKNDSGEWSVTVENVPAGAFRYHFQVDGATVLDPNNPATSQANATVWNLALMTGDARFDRRDVAQGTLSQVTYRNPELGLDRRAHVYTPAGYEKSTEAYPVFYLLHGATDSDASWSTVGRAATIMDNLIAEGKAVPMIVVMPDGHTGKFSFGPNTQPSFEEQMAEFKQEFTQVLRPLIESRYRTINDRAHRALGGLSMGGFQTLDIAFEQPEDFGYVMVMSSGIFGISGGAGGQAPDNRWAEAHADALSADSTKTGLKLFWIGCGKEDFLLSTAQGTVELFKSHQFEVEYAETDGGHTWFNWRNYLADLAPRLFQP